MRSLAFFVVIIVSLFSGGVIRAQTATRTSTRTPTATRTATATPTPTPVVGCDFTLKVNDNTDGGTLTLDPGAPIFHNKCPKNGITITNLGANSVNRSFTLDCNNAGTITGTGSAVGTGIKVRGTAIAVYNCNVSGFNNGIVASGKGVDIEANTVQNSVIKAGAGGNGFMVRSKGPASQNSNNYLDSYVLGNTSQKNAGYGFKISGNAVTADNGTTTGNTTSVFNNTAAQNLLGGFLGRGKTDTFGSLNNGTQANAAISNGTVAKPAFGFRITNSSCCYPNSLSYSQAISNNGPGIIYQGRDDGTNCYGPTGGPPCYASGLDLAPGDIQSISNCPSSPSGCTCPKGFVSLTPGNPPAASTDGQICVKTTATCSQTVLNNCF